MASNPRQRLIVSVFFYQWAQVLISKIVFKLFGYNDSAFIIFCGKRALPKTLWVLAMNPNLNSIIGEEDGGVNEKNHF